MSINRTVKRAFGSMDSSPAKPSDVSNVTIATGDHELDSNTSEGFLAVSGLSGLPIRRRIDEFQVLQESEPLQLHEQHYSSYSLQNEMGHGIDFSGMSDQEDGPENISGRQIPFTHHESGDGPSNHPDAQILNDAGDPGNLECFDPKSPPSLLSVAERPIPSSQRNSEPSLNAHDGVLNEHLDVESPPSLLSVAERPIPCSRHDSGDGPSSNSDVVPNDAGSSECVELGSPHTLLSPRSDSEIVDTLFPPRLKGLIQSIEKDVLTKVELRTKEWFNIKCLKAVFDSIIKYNSSVTHVDAEVRATKFPRIRPDVVY